MPVTEKERREQALKSLEAVFAALTKKWKNEHHNDLDRVENQLRRGNQALEFLRGLRAFMLETQPEWDKFTEAVDGLLGPPEGDDNTSEEPETPSDNAGA